jgi:hypothetical protein
MSSDARVAAELNQFPDKDGFGNKGSKKLILNYYLNFFRLKKKLWVDVCRPIHAKNNGWRDDVTSTHFHTSVSTVVRICVWQHRTNKTDLEKTKTDGVIARSNQRRIHKAMYKRYTDQEEHARKFEMELDFVCIYALCCCWTEWCNIHITRAFSISAFPFICHHILIDANGTRTISLIERFLSQSGKVSERSPPRYWRGRANLWSCLVVPPALPSFSFIWPVSVSSVLSCVCTRWNFYFIPLQRQMEETQGGGKRNAVRIANRCRAALWKCWIVEGLLTAPQLRILGGFNWKWRRKSISDVFYQAETLCRDQRV